MENYVASIQLLGLRDQNMPVFKENRVKRLQSIEKMNKLINIMPRLAPKMPKNLAFLDELDPEWDDKMIYPVVNHFQLLSRFTYWALYTAFYGYNWNVLHGNPRLRLLAYSYPFISGMFLVSMAGQYTEEVQKVRLFENYCAVRARELFEQNKFMLEHEHFKRLVWFGEDLTDTLRRVHRQANNHDASDFKDSELILQDFIRRYSDPLNPDQAMFTEEGRVKQLN